FAHEEFGVYYVRDYYYYRNAIALPGVGFASRSREGADRQDNELGSLTFNEVEINPQTGLPNDDPTGAPPTSDANVLARLQDFPHHNHPSDFRTNDRFNLEALLAQGATVLDLSRRANHAYERAAFHLTMALESDPRRRPVYDHFVRLHGLAGQWDE